MASKKNSVTEVTINVKDLLKKIKNKDDVTLGEVISEKLKELCKWTTRT